jgi:phosphatidylglycerophosphate synthase
MTRDLRSLTANVERRLLVAIARRLPSWVMPDHLTALGALALAGAAVCYRVVPLTKWAVLGVNLFLALNWFGDSLDGTLARVRDRQRPKYGYYVDHLIDAFGALLLLAGLAGSGLVAPPIAWALIVAYSLLGVHMALKADTLEIHQIAFAGIGGTELRILLGALNVAAVTVSLPAGAPRIFDVGGVIALVAIGGTLLVDAVRTAVELARRERIEEGGD